MYNTSKIRPLGNYLGPSVIIENLMRIRVTSVKWTWLGLEWLLDSLHVDDVAPPVVKLSDAKCHAILLSSFLIKNSFNYDVK